MTSRCFRLFPAAGIFLGLLLVPGLPLPAQEPAPEPEESFTEAIEVSVVNLDVFVTDKKGQPLAGLKREDFEIYEDGKPVEITNFYAESGPAVLPSRDSAAAGTPAAPAVRPPEQQLRLVIFVDDTNITPTGRGMILDRLHDFLRSELRPGDQVMLVRYAHSLEIRREFTGDLARIASDVAALKPLSSDLGGRDITRADALEQIGDVLETQGWDVSIETLLRNYAGRETLRLAGALDALGSVVSWLGGVSGRKAILYVSDGLPLVPGTDLYQWAAIRMAQQRRAFSSGTTISGIGSQEYDATRRFRELTAQASRNRVTLYPIEAAGSRTVRGTLIQELLVQNDQNGLRFLAQDTGGQAMLNAGDPLAALRQMGQDLTTYYSLGYQPQRPGDEVEHKIEVKVKVKGAQVRHRQWYRDKPVNEAIAERTLAVMRFGPEDNPLDARVEIGAAKEQGDSVLVPVRVKVPMSKLYLQPGEGKRSGRLRLYLVASGGGTTTPVRQTKLVTLNVPESDFAAVATKEYTHEIGISLKKGTYALGVGVRDELAAATSYLRKEFVLGEGEAGK
ncbi:MAG TPA: VWA domain-containing protein [Thermoanaerobaculia bacterium]